MKMQRIRNAILAVPIALLITSSSAVVLGADWIKCPVGAQCERLSPGRWLQSYGAAEDQGPGGGGGTWAYLETEGQNSVECGPGLMGDPIYGVVKSCEIQKIGPREGEVWTLCGAEAGTCGLGLKDYAAQEGKSETNLYRKVRYGVGNRWVYRHMQNDFTCGWTGLGLNIDPAPGVDKHCEVEKAVLEAPNWKPCGGEGAVCELKPGRPFLVRYGDEARKEFIIQALGGSKFTCSLGTFGVDPVPNVKKFCSVAEQIDIKDVVGGWRKVGSCRGDSESCVITKKLEVGMMQGSGMSSEWTAAFEVTVGGEWLGGSAKSSYSTSLAITQSFEKSKSEAQEIGCTGMSLWQWETGVTQTCDFTGKLCETVARSVDYLCLKDQNPDEITPEVLQNIDDKRLQRGTLKTN